MSARTRKPDYRQRLDMPGSSTHAIQIAVRLVRAFGHRAPTWREIADKFGCDRATAYRWRRAYCDAMGIAA